MTYSVRRNNLNFEKESLVPSVVIDVIRYRRLNSWDLVLKRASGAPDVEESRTTRWYVRFLSSTIRFRIDAATINWDWDVLKVDKASSFSHSAVVSISRKWILNRNPRL